MAEHLCSVRVDGCSREVDPAIHPTLAEALRDACGVTAVKIGCAIGECGACSVLLDGRVVAACLVPTALAGEREVITVEGLEDDATTEVLVRCFVERGATQCGFCAPGQLVMARALLDRHPRPTRTEIVAWMSANLCRCTGYEAIIDAVVAAARSTGPDPAPSGAVDVADPW